MSITPNKKVTLEEIRDVVRAEFGDKFECDVVEDRWISGMNSIKNAFAGATAGDQRDMCVLVTKNARTAVRVTIASNGKIKFGSVVPNNTLSSVQGAVAKQGGLIGSLLLSGIIKLSQRKLVKKVERVLAEKFAGGVSTPETEETTSQETPAE